VRTAIPAITALYLDRTMPPLPGTIRGVAGDSGRHIAPQTAHFCPPGVIKNYRALWGTPVRFLAARGHGIAQVGRAEWQH